MRKWHFSALSLFLLAGCGQGEHSPAVDGSKYLLKDEPAGALSVLAAKESTKDGDDIVLVGRIGGSNQPMTPGRASFTIVDTSLVPCNERGDDACQTPWDY